MKTTLYTYFTCAIFMSAQAQSETQLNYQLAHPESLFMTRSSFEALDLSVQELVADRVIFLEDLEHFSEALDAEHVVPSSDVELSEADKIKQWLGTHPSVKIVKRSEFDASSSELQMIYEESHVLVLIGEELTTADIANY